MNEEDVGKTTCPHCQKREWFLYYFIQGQLRVAVCTNCVEKYGVEKAYKFIL